VDSSRYAPGPTLGHSPGRSQTAESCLGSSAQQCLCASKWCHARSCCVSGNRPSAAAWAFPAIDAKVIDLSSYSAADFDRGASRVREALWIAASLLFFRAPWPIPSAARRGLLRIFGAKVGRGVVLRSGICITFPWRLTAGDHVWIGENVRILNLAPVSIGSHVCVSQEVFLCTGSHDFNRRNFALKTAPICIQDHSWIAARAFIGPAVTVGRRSLVAAGCVLMRSIPENSRVAGNPARPWAPSANYGREQGCIS
jgi:putative colanic acid biosynthesis acetyltransferase WcaF